MNASLMGSAAGGARWVLADNLLRQFLGLAVYLVLARLLGPQAFGLLALAGVAITFSKIFIDGALGDAVVQRQQADPGFLDTVFVIAGVMGVLLSCGLFLVAGPVAAIMGQAQLAPLLQWLAPVIALNALCVVHQALLQRKFAYRAFTIRTGLGLVAGGTVGIAMAVAGYGPFSLVGQQLVQAVINLAVLWTASRWRPGLAASLADFKELTHFSLPLIAGNFLNFVNRKGDDLLIGLVLGPTALGYYALAYQVLLVLEQLLSRGFDSVGLSTFSRQQHDERALRETLLRFTQLAGTIAIPVFLGAAVVAPIALPLAFGEQWRPAVPVFQWLSGAGLLHAVFHFNHAVFKARGRPDMSLGVSALNAVANFILFLLVVRLGVVAVAAAYTLRAWVLAPVGLFLIRELIGLSIRDFARQFLFPVLAGLIMIGVVGWLLPDAYSLLGLAAQISVGAVLYAGLTARFMRAELNQLLLSLKNPTMRVARS